jgi:hypothetical protein
MDFLRGIQIFRKGDRVIHEQTGISYIVSYVHVRGYELMLNMEDGSKINSKEVYKIS